MIVVFKYANFTCCCGTCCDGTTLFGHASLWCSHEGFGLSAGNRRAHFDSWEDFTHAQGKFGTVERYACVPTREDHPTAKGDERTLLKQEITISESHMYNWWKGLKFNEGGRDCADLVVDALRAAGASRTSVWARRPGSLFVLTPDASVAYAVGLARAMCNHAGINRESYQNLIRDSNLGELEGVNQFQGP